MTDLQWEQHGSGPPTMIWGHGLTSSRHGDDIGPLAGLTAAVASAGIRTVRYDARGHGTSPKPAEAAAYAWERLALDMLAVADAAGAATFCAAGASMGAATALYAALADPERVDSLALVVPPTAWESRAAQRSTYETMAGIVESRGPDRLLDLSRRQPPSTMFGEAGKERSLTNLAAMDPIAFPHVMRGAAASDLPPTEAIESITVPALILAWTGDTGHPVSTAERLRDLLPQSELHVADTPDEVATWPGVLVGFLAATI